MGILIALIIFAAWTSHLYYSLAFVTVDFSSPLLYLHIFLQTYLFTGLFITAHDAIHGTVSSSAKLNKYIINTASFLFAGLSPSKLIKNHHLHHSFPGSDKDPDYSSSPNFFVWWFSFLKKYTSWSQLIIMAVSFNILKFFFAEINLWLLWIIPSVLSTFQLFYFGTYRPHKTPHTDSMQPHNARSQNKNHLWGMLSCYFFGYHYEHHQYPHTPWWKLYSKKTN
jgi:beta-carotene/zeaxanthin 4-ketolase